MPSDNHLLNIHILLPLALYVIPLVFMTEYVAQQLWAFIHQSLEEIENFSPSSSLLPTPPPSSSLEEGNPVTTYATLSSSTFPVLPVKMKGKQQERGLQPLCKPVEPLPCLVCQSK